MRKQIWEIGHRYMRPEYRFISTKLENISINEVLVNGGNCLLTESTTLDSVVFTNSAVIDLGGNTLSIDKITNEGSLIIKNGKLEGNTIYNKGKLTLDNVVYNAKNFAVFCDNKDYESIPGESGEPKMTLTITDCDIKSEAAYAIKNQSYSRVVIKDSNIEGGVSVESCYAEISNSILQANKYYGLHVYCGIVDYSDCVIEGKDKDIYIQLKSEIEPDKYQYSSTVNGVVYSPLDIEVGTGIIQNYGN